MMLPREFNRDVVSLFWDLGLLQIMLPEKYKGGQADPDFRRNQPDPEGDHRKRAGERL